MEAAKKMRNTATSQNRSLKLLEPSRSFMHIISGHSSKQRFPFLILFNILEVCLNQIPGQSYFSLKKFDLLSLQTMIGMGMVFVKQVVDKNLEDDKNTSWFIA